MISRGNLKDSFIYEDHKPSGYPGWRPSGCDTCKRVLENVQKSTLSVVKLNIMYFSFLKRVLKAGQKHEQTSSIIKTFLVKRASVLTHFKLIPVESLSSEQLDRRFSEIEEILVLESAETEAFIGMVAQAVGVQFNPLKRV